MTYTTYYCFFTLSFSEILYFMEVIAGIVMGMGLKNPCLNNLVLVFMLGER